MNIERINKLTGEILKSKGAIAKIEKLARKLAEDKGDLNVKLAVEMPTSHRNNVGDSQGINVYMDGRIIFSGADMFGDIPPPPPQYSAPAKNGFEQDNIPNELALIMLESMIKYYNDQVATLTQELEELIEPVKIGLKSISSNYLFPKD